ncbi:MAG TPA: MmcQ/YjbR family DNA-binding protein [Acidimicrobiia bacterium]|nr:MmcQ/YjbR family DNA-binding protein [Acidimicrobiia bacterium]HYJ24894.1 MmcQ/YjbR family DNA-binding protein [Acidimicrobiia bacterium]
MGLTADHLSRLRRLCMSLPEVEERVSHGEPAWFIRGKRQFVTYADHHHDARVAFWCSAPEGAQHVLTTTDPDRYFIPPYVGGRGWVGCYLDVEVDWEALEEIVVDAYVTVAPARLSAEIPRD